MSRYNVRASVHGHHWDASVGTRGSIRTTRNAATASTSSVLGITKSGQPCKKCIRKGDFCHLHVSQRTSSGDPVRTTSADRARTDVHTSDGRVFGVTKNGTPCTICLRQNKFCHQHVSQDPRKRATLRTFGITKDGEPCKRCIQQNNFCYQHVSQRRVASDAVSVDIQLTARPVPPPRRPPSNRGRSSRPNYAQLGSEFGHLVQDSWDPVFQASSVVTPTSTPNVIPVRRVEVEVPTTISVRRHRRPAQTTATPRTNTSEHSPTDIAATRTVSSETKECCICMEPVEAHHDHKELQCCHNSFHRRCIRRWFHLGSATCPMCRASVG